MNIPSVQRHSPVPRVPWFLRTKKHLLLILALALGLPLTALTVGIVWNARRALYAQAVHENTTAARLAAQVVERHFDGLKRSVELAALSPTLQMAITRGDVAAGEIELRRLLDITVDFDRAFVTDAAGIERFDWPKDERVVGQSFAFRDWYKSVTRLDRTYVSEVYRRAALDQAAIVAIATPIGGAPGARAGYLVAQHRIDQLAARLAATDPGLGGKLTLIDQHEHWIARGESSVEPQPLESHSVAQTLITEKGTAAEGPDPETREPSLFSLAEVDALGWVVLAQQSKAQVLAPADRLQRWILFLSGLCVASVVLASFAWLDVFRRQHLALHLLQRQKDLLSGMIVHDLRNPIGVALISIESAKLGLPASATEVHADLDHAHAAAGRTLELVNVILDVMRMEDGVLRLQRSEDDIAELLREKVEEHRPLAKAGSIELEAHVPADPPRLLVDSRLLRRVVDNLIVNAIKHTQRGGHIDVTLESDANSDRARLRIVDDGEGMPPELLPRLFQKYGRIEGQKMSRAYDTGLGLLFCRMAVELHGGTIAAQSALGKGTAILIDLPRA
ncbi:MAG TPA: sensor histidine kinase [Planctomycetota bacterium]|nr:sensor histidine kinase [Planctomycetota bacterium]